MAILDTKAGERHEQDEGGSTTPRETSLEFSGETTGAGRNKRHDGG